jgi:hypothetical protein
LRLGDSIHANRSGRLGRRLRPPPALPAPRPPRVRKPPRKGRLSRRIPPPPRPSLTSSQSQLNPRLRRRRQSTAYLLQLRPPLSPNSSPAQTRRCN